MSQQLRHANLGAKVLGHAGDGREALDWDYLNALEPDGSQFVTMEVCSWRRATGVGSGTGRSGRGWVRREDPALTNAGFSVTSGA